MRDVWKRIQETFRSDQTHPDAHRRETVRVSTLSKEVRRQIYFGCSPANAHRQERTSVQHLQYVLLLQRKPQNSHALAHRSKTLEVLLLWDEI